MAKVSLTAQRLFLFSRPERLGLKEKEDERPTPLHRKRRHARDRGSSIASPRLCAPSWLQDELRRALARKRDENRIFHSCVFARPPSVVAMGSFETDIVQQKFRDARTPRAWVHRTFESSRPSAPGVRKAYSAMCALGAPRASADDITAT